MSSIPLPALGLHTQQDSPLDQYARALQIRNMQQQQALLPGQLQAQQQQLQHGQQQLQMGQMDIESQKAMMKAWMESGGDYDKAATLAAQYGAKPADAINFKMLGMKAQEANINLLNAKGARALTEADLMQGAHDTVAKAAPEQRPQVWQQQLISLQRAGVDVSQLPLQYPGDQYLEMIGPGLKGHTKQLDDLAKQMGIQKTEAETQKLQLEVKGLAAVGGMTPQMQEVRYRQILAKSQSGQPLTAEESQFAKGYEASQAKTTTQSDTLGVTSTSTSRPAGLALSGRGGGPASGPAKDALPSTRDALVDSIGQYRYDPRTFSRMTLKHPEILAQVAQKYPDFNQSQYNVINKAVSDLAANGKTGQQLTSYNTFLRHAGDAFDAVSNLENTDIRLFNKPMNWLRQNSGDPRVASFLAKMHPVQKEFQSFLIGNHALYEDDRKDAKQLFDENSSPAQIKAVLQSLAHTGGARIDELNNTFKRVTNRDIPNLVSPQAAQAYNKITGTPAATPAKAAENDPFAQFGGRAH